MRSYFNTRGSTVTAAVIYDNISIYTYIPYSIISLALIY